MTTNVYDINAGLLTSDSRWSAPLEDGWILYVDDTGYDKIVYDIQLGILFAGDLRKIDLWKTWFLEGRINEAPSEVDGISLIIIDMTTGEIVFKTDYLLESSTSKGVEAYYSGTGGPYAKDCWQINRCAKRAVGTAISADMLSGGSVVYLDRIDRDTNVTNAATQYDVINKMKGLGMMFNKNSNNAVHIKDAANESSNPELQSIAQKALKGGISVSAPFPGMAQPWTNEKKSELSAVLNKYKPK